MRFSSEDDMDNVFKKAWMYYSKYMQELCGQLNRYHGTSYSIRYWKLTVGKWLWDYIMLLYGQYDLLSKEKTCSHCEENFDINNFSSGLDLRNYIRKPEIIQWIRQYICYYKKMYVQYDRHDIMVNLYVNRTTGSKNIDEYMHFSCWEMGDSAVSEMIEDLMDKRSSYIFEKMLECNNIILLPLLSYEYKEKERANKFRNSLLGDIKDEFDFIFWNSLQWNLPQVYIELFKNVCLQVKKVYPHKKYERIYVIDAMDYQFYLLDFYIAFQVEKFSCQYISIQHGGGGYGMHKIAGEVQFERDISDRFVSWGWPGKDVISMPNLLLEKMKRIRCRKNKGGILYVTTLEVKERGFLGGWISQDDYREWIVRFLNDILSEKLICVDWRSYQMRLGDTGENQLDVVLNNLKTIKGKLVVNAYGTFYSRVDKARLVVIDHCSTTMLETLGGDIPTILFWNQLALPLKKNAEKMLVRLRAVGIFHDTPEHAAAFIKEIYQDPQTWWNSEAVRNVRKEFVKEFSNKSNDIIGSYVSLFKTGKRVPEYEVKNTIKQYCYHMDWKYWAMLFGLKIFDIVHFVKYQLVRVIRRIRY